MAIAVASKNVTSVQDLAVVANVMVNTVARSPQIRGTIRADVRNNLIANNYGTSITINRHTSGPTLASGWITGNIFKHGPDTTNPENAITAGNEGDVDGVGYVVNSNVQISYPVGGTGQGVQTDFVLEDTVNMNLAGSPARDTEDGNNTIFLDGNDDPKCIGASVPTRSTADARVISEINGINLDAMLATAEIGIGPRVPWDIGLCGIQSGSRKCFAEGDPLTDSSTWLDQQGQRDYTEYVGSNTHPVDYDTDSDGIPDAYEQRIIAAYAGVNTLADVTATTDADNDTYTDFEEWTHELAASCAFSQ